MYFANPTGTTAVHDAMKAGQFGFINTPRQGNQLLPGVAWMADNGCFGKHFDEGKWWEWLQSKDVESCAFAVAPDVVGDAAATLARSAPWLPRIRALGFRVAFVAQDGQEHLPLPWDSFDVLFVGGTTAWKLGAGVRQLVRDAKSRGMWVHMGRVNSLRRYRYCEAIGCDSADGTYLTFGPEVNLPKVLHWVNHVDSNPGLFGWDA